MAGRRIQKAVSRRFCFAGARNLDPFTTLGYFAKNNSGNSMHPRKDIEELATVFKALGHPSRLAMVDALGQGERCVCELRDLVGADMSTVSKHLALLKQAGVVRAEKRGNQVFYSLFLPCVTTFLACVNRMQLRGLAQELKCTPGDTTCGLLDGNIPQP